MRCAGTKGWAWLLVGVVILAATSTASADWNRYGVIEITNTSEATVSYQLRWGDGAWEDSTLEPGESLCHWYPFRFVNENRAPVPYIRYYTGINRKGMLQTYELDFYNSPTKNANGKKYTFEERANKQGQGYIILTDPDK